MTGLLKLHCFPNVFAYLNRSACVWLGGVHLKSPDDPDNPSFLPCTPHGAKCCEGEMQVCGPQGDTPSACLVSAVWASSEHNQQMKGSHGYACTPGVIMPPVHTQLAQSSVLRLAPNTFEARLKILNLRCASAHNLRCCARFDSLSSRPFTLMCWTGKSCARNVLYQGSRRLNDRNARFNYTVETSRRYRKD